MSLSLWDDAVAGVVRYERAVAPCRAIGSAVWRWLSAWARVWRRVAPATAAS
jgi:hypothetical protein